MKIVKRELKGAYNLDNNGQKRWGIGICGCCIACQTGIKRE